MARRYSSEGIAHNCAHLKLSDAARLVLFHSKEKELTQSWRFFLICLAFPKKNRWLSQSRVPSYIACALERADGSFFAQAKRSHHAVSTMQILFVKKLFHPLLTTSNSETKALIRGLPPLFEHFLKVYSIVQVLKIMFLPIKHLLGLYGR